VETKYCRDCDANRPASEFSRNKRSGDGLSFYCREHLSERSLRSREARRTTPRKHRFVPPGLIVPDGQKWCPDCERVLGMEEFPRTRASSSGRATYCLPCHNARGKKSREAAGGSRTYHLSRHYGITAQEADAMLADQGGLCGLCRAAPADHVDHDHATDHATGAVRDLLCFDCNGGLGQFKDDPALLRAAARYIEAHRAGRAARAADALREVTSRPESPPVGSSQRPPGSITNRRSTGLTSTDGRRAAAREAGE
jgi:hypothetical protein